MAAVSWSLDIYYIYYIYINLFIIFVLYPSNKL